MTLHCTISTKLKRVPEVDRAADTPLPEGSNSLPQPLVLEGTPEEPDEFDLADRIALHTVEDSPQQAGQRYATLERRLAQRDGIERVSDRTGDATDGEGESTNSPEGED